MLNRILPLVPFLFLLACSETNVENPTSPTRNTEPTPAPTPVKADTIEFRVVGNSPAVLIRTADSINGLSQTITGLPFVYTVDSTRATIFLSIDASATMPHPTFLNSFLSGQILVNGSVFREANASAFMPTITISGTWRR